MKICYFNPTNNIRRPIAELANILAQEGHKITIVYPFSNACPTKNWVANEAIKNDNIKAIAVKSWYFAPLRYSFPNFLQLFKIIKKVFRNNDKIHIWEYYYPLSVIPLLYASLNKKRRKRTILTTDGFVGYSYRPKKPAWLVPAFKLYTQLFARFLFKIPRTMTTYGKAMLPFARKAGVPMKKLRVVSTGIHLDRFKEIDQKKIKQLKEEFKIKTGEKVILFVGMLTERKGVDKVIKISNRLLDEKFKIKTLIIGDSHGKNEFKKFVKQEHKDQIIFAGGRKDIPGLMKLADVLLLPSEGEGLPGVVMEAMASGLSVVATKEGCTPDLIEDGEEGFLIRLNGNYYNKVKDLLKNKKLRMMMSNKAIKKINNFNWKIVLRKYEKLYSGK